MLQRARVGMSVEGLHVIAFHKEDRIPVGASSSRPGAYQAADGLLALCARHGLAIENVAIDDSGTQSVCDIVEVESGRKPIRCNFTSKADVVVGEGGVAAAPKYRNLVTEMWHAAARLVRERQVRGLPDAAADQMCRRRYLRDLKPLALESKREYKKRQSGQRSPDEADALVLCVRAAMRVAGLRAGRVPDRRAVGFERASEDSGFVSGAGVRPVFSSGYAGGPSADRYAAYARGFLKFGFRG